jgi:hypothetical protein
MVTGPEFGSDEIYYKTRDQLFWRRWDFQKGNGALMRRRLRSGERNWVCPVGTSDGFTELHQSSIGTMAGHDIQTDAPLNRVSANSFRARIDATR